MNLFGSLGFAWQTSSDNCIISYNLRVCAHLGTVLYSARREQDHKPLLCYPTSSYCTRIVFFFLAKLPEAKEKPAAKMEKPENVLRSKTTNWQTAVKITFCIKVGRCIHERKPRILHYVWQILVSRWLLWSKSGYQLEPVAFTKELFLFLTEWYSFFLLWPWFFFLPRACSPFWFFHEQRFFHRQGSSRCEFCWVCGEYHKIRAQFQIKEKSIFSAIEDGK